MSAGLRSLPDVAVVVVDGHVAVRLADGHHVAPLLPLYDVRVDPALRRRDRYRHPPAPITSTSVKVTTVFDLISEVRLTNFLANFFFFYVSLF